MSPISPEKACLYPPPEEWAAIRAEVLERDGRCCKWCRKPNQTYVVVGPGGTWARDDADYRWRDQHGDRLPEGAKVEPLLDEHGGPKVIRCVLTVAHLDHDPSNNGAPGNRPNLAALCQRCHLLWDQGEHNENSRKTRARKMGQIGLFEEARP